MIQYHILVTNTFTACSHFTIYSDIAVQQRDKVVAIVTDSHRLDGFPNTSVHHYSLSSLILCNTSVMQEKLYDKICSNHNTVKLVA